MSKPVNFNSMKMPISVLVPIPLREELRVRAAGYGIPMTRLVQELIEIGLSKIKAEETPSAA